MIFNKIKKWFLLTLRLQREQYRLAADLQATKKELATLQAYLDDYQKVAIAPLIARLLVNSPDVSNDQLEEVIDQLKINKTPYDAFIAILAADPITSHFQCKLPHFRELMADKVILNKGILKALGWRDRITIVDVGAQMLDSSDHVYTNLVKSVPTCIIGFEPLSDELEKRSKAKKNVKIYPYMIGDGGKRKFNITKFSPASSNHTPNSVFLEKFHALSEMLMIEKTINVDTECLDNIKELNSCDLLKLDVQGSELDVLRGANKTLLNTCVVYLEVEHAEIYLSQPLYSDIDQYLRGSGFAFIDFKDPGYITYRENNRGYGGSRRAWSDAIYFKNDEELMKMDVQKILKAAIIAHCNYSMWDLTAHYLEMYDQLSQSNLAQRYIYEIDSAIYPPVNQ